MKIYTRTGDDGTTGLFGGDRVKKASARVDAYGTVDEANATIGAARAATQDGWIDAILSDVQHDLFIVGAELACTAGKEHKLQMRLIDAADAERLERAIDGAHEGLPELRSFVLPGGTSQSAALHVARCVVRRAERAVLDARHESPIRSEVIVYLNRLSDLLFALARRANFLANVPDVSWDRGART